MFPANSIRAMLNDRLSISNGVFEPVVRRHTELGACPKICSADSSPLFNKRLLTDVVIVNRVPW